MTLPVLMRCISELDTRKSPGFDSIFLDDIKHNSEFLTILKDCFNLIIKTQCFPDCLKIALVKPLFKSGSPECLSNYRPISILSCLDKIFEHYVNNELTNFLERHGILANEQYGFRKNRGTNDALQDFTDYVYSNMDHNMYTLSVFIDFSKAFDTIDHKKLLLCMENIGICGPVLELFKSYLHNRHFIVKMTSYESEPTKINCGVPQGSKLGPTLFLILINSLPSLIHACKIVLYADDTVLSAHATTLESAIDMIRNDLIILQTWAHDFGIVINHTKTKVMCFHSAHKHPAYDLVNVQMHTYDCLHNKSYYTICSCDPIEMVTQYKYLGIWLDCHMSFKAHVDYITQKLRCAAVCLHRLTYYKFPRHILKQVYFALAESYISYCIESWGTVSDSTLQPIRYLQNKMSGS